MQLNGVPYEHWLKSCIAYLNSQHFDHEHSHRYLPYSAFRKKVIEIFKRAEMTQYQIKELWTVLQYENEGPGFVRWRWRNFLNCRMMKQEVMAVPAFCDGLWDRGVPAFLASQARNSAARAVRIAAEALGVKSNKIEIKRRSKCTKTPCYWPSYGSA